MKIDSIANSAALPTLDARGASVAIVCARFNDFIVDQLLAGARAAWSKHGGDEAALSEYRVPGAFELPIACQELALRGRHAAIIALGCVIRGDTAHFDFVAGECARGIMHVGLETGVPIIFGVLTVESRAQAEERADPARMNKGGEALEAALEMAQLLRKVRS